MADDPVYRLMRAARQRLDSGSSAQPRQNDVERCITFRIAEECYAIGLVSVKEVIVPPEIVPVPGTDPEVLGVINLRGSVLTVINGRQVLGLAGCPDGTAARILVLEEADGCVGVLVDAVEDILAVDLAAFDVRPLGEDTETVAHIRGTIAVGDQIAFVMRTSGLLGTMARP